MPFQPNAQFTRCVYNLQCCECIPWALYSQCKLKFQEAQCLREELLGTMYSCGSLLSEQLVQEASPQLTDIVSCAFVRTNLGCADQIETSYYSSGVFADVCIHCGHPNGIAKEEKAVDILPTCENCFQD